MKILWYADFEGDEKQLAEVNTIFDELTAELGGKVEGPFYPQDASLLYIFDAPSHAWLNESGRRFIPRAEEAGIPITPLRYEIAVTPREFWGDDAT